MPTTRSSTSVGTIAKNATGTTRIDVAVASSMTLTATASSTIAASPTICTRTSRPRVERRQWCVKIAPNTSISAKNAR